MKESPIFTKTYNWLQWIMPVSMRFSKSQRFVMAKRLQELSLDFYDHLIFATKQPNKQSAHLVNADIALERLRLSLRLCKDMELISKGQYEHGSRSLAELGRLLGAWQKRAK